MTKFIWSDLKSVFATANGLEPDLIANGAELHTNVHLNAIQIHLAKVGMSLSCTCIHEDYSFVPAEYISGQWYSKSQQVLYSHYISSKL